MIRKIAVHEVMTTRLVTIGPEASINDAIHLLLEHEVSGLPIVDDQGYLVGMLTEQDCLRSAYRSGYYQDPDRTIAEAMTHDVTTIDADEDLMIATTLFLKRSFRRLPVLREGRLVGVVSRRDALRALRMLW